MRFAGENLVFGLIAACLVPWILWTLERGVRNGRLPVGRAYVDRAERPGAYRFLLCLYAAAAFGVGFIAVDLLFNISSRIWS
ncbi:MAG: hypothetical protein E6G94_04670 [Alphaproteobacteria bacterium]|nr:MAG: hypothetical protein E6G94_04670 [Alphaproteobacteria bacterium]